MFCDLSNYGEKLNEKISRKINVNMYINNKNSSKIQDEKRFCSVVFPSQLVLTEPVGQNLQALNPLVLMQLQAVNAVKPVVLYQVERRINRHLVETNVSLSSSKTPEPKIPEICELKTIK